MATRVRRKELITAQRQEQILKAALTVFSRKGYGEATVADVAQEAGASVGTIYNYYNDKQELLISLIAQNLILGNLGHILSHTDSRTTNDLITAIIEDRLKTGFENAQKIIFLFFEIQRSAKLRHQYSEKVIRPVIKIFETYIRTQIKEGDFRQLDETIISRALVGMVIGVMILFRLEGKSSPYQKDKTQEIAKELSDLLLLGLKRVPKKQGTLNGQ